MNLNTTITEILGTDSISGSRITINENFNTLKEAIEELNLGISVLNFTASAVMSTVEFRAPSISVVNGSLSVNGGNIVCDTDAQIDQNLSVGGNMNISGDLNANIVNAGNIVISSGNVLQIGSTVLNEQQLQSLLGLI